ncbi:5'-nucleotidase, lipoprotein e(P4) family [Francisella sp. Scap27]|uniref:HAD family acid phosphatase n=1 Tax=Francisella sp. Scap27 TaxID=2589986 RepID=UPI0015BFCBF7|nr:HAD family acid phosphatase [Francisella sp. Scap27]QLE78728.1 5'-nucleotidase, lipoprotein e(P4) family [Francisella sp. Scap27]
MKFKKIILALVIGQLSIVSLGFATGCDSQNIDGVKWYHDSVERKAISLEVYNLAKIKIAKQIKKEKLQSGTWGVILDVDETTLDNSWLEYDNYKNYQYDSDKFDKALKEEKSIAVPGAKMLTNFVHKKGGFVSLVTNRTGNDEKLIKATKENLSEQGIYYDQILFTNKIQKGYNNKNPRFKAVITGKYSDGMIYTNKLPAHDIIAYFGDNIQDFPAMSQEKMKTADDSQFDVFGSKYFILPNPMYGSWQ